MAPSASAVIYGGVEVKGIVFDGVPNTDIRLFGKAECNACRRVSVALVIEADVKVARENAKKAAALMKPRAA